MDAGVSAVRTSPSRGPHGLLLSVPTFVKVLGIALGMAIFIGAGLLLQIHRTWHAHLTSELQDRGRHLALRVAADCVELSRAGLAGEIPDALQHSLTATPDVVSVTLLSPDGSILAEAKANAIPADRDLLVQASAPVGQGPHQLAVVLSTLRIDHEIAWLTRRLAATTALITLLGLFAAAWLTRLFAHPLEQLVTLTRAVKAGDYHVRAPIHARDEIGHLAAAFNDMTDALAQKEAVRQHLLRQVIRAGEDERRRIARDLHDHTGQALTSQIAALSALETTAPSPASRMLLAELRQQTEQTLADVHDLTVNLRPSVLDDFGLLAALQQHCRFFAQSSGVHVQCADLGLDGARLPSELELTIYRVVQEALTNAVRHGQATRVHVLVQNQHARVLATVRDNGRGFDAGQWRSLAAAGQHLGLLGIEERVTLLNGSFCVESAPGRGTSIHAQFPLTTPP